MRKIFVLFMILMFGFSYAAISISSVSTSSSVYKPGESGAITMTISNSDASSTIKSVSITAYGVPEFTYKETTSIGDMNPGTSTVISIPITVKNDAKSGIYVFDLKVQGIVTTATESNLNYKSSSVAIFVLRQPLFTLSDYPSIYYEGDEFPITINNYGGGAKNVRITFQEPFALSGSNEIFISNLSARSNQSLNLNLNVGNVDEGQNTMNISITYEDELGNTEEKTKSLTFVVKKGQTDLVFTQQGEILAKTEGNVQFIVSNSGKALKDLKLKFDQTDFIVKSGNEIKVGDIGAGETKTISFPLYADISPGTVNVDATITYVEDGKETSKSITIPMGISSNSDVQVFLEAKPIPVIKGQEETLSVTVANTWDYQIESVSVRVEGDFYELISVQNDQYIGLLSKDDFSSVQFKVKIKDDAPDEGNLKVYIKYKDPSGIWLEKEKTIPLSIGNMQIEQPNLVFYGFVVLVLVGIVYYFFLRKKK
ncbi:hypothetical protein KJ780_04000 [Candidatus Micrarchaeota archaeon]|nr:hypothetical protein [Candidatus Micrarchaeota archaeon]